MAISTFLLHLAMTFAVLQVTKTISTVNRRFVFQVTESLWGPWTESGSCSATCGAGTKSRTRECYVRSQMSPVCVGSSTDTQACNQPACVPKPSSQSPCSDVATNCREIDNTQGVCSKFQSWSRTNCNKYCGFCRVSVAQTCVDNITTCAMYGQTVCKEYTNWATRNCNKFCGFCHDATAVTNKPSILNGAWGSWSSLTSCSATCGNGVVHRTRTCTSPGPASGGAPCPGNSHENYACNLGPCLNTGAVNGGWSTWNSWSSCSVSCYFGVQSRERGCTNPAPSGGGAGCPGNQTESQLCTPGPCAAWTHWFDGACSSNCGQGQMERLRHCGTGHDDDCPGNAYEIATCTGTNCG